MKSLKISLFIFVVIIFICGCTSINSKQAEEKAVEFVDNNVKFFAKEENSALTLPQYNVSSISSYREDKNWVVVMHIYADLGNETKKNDLVIKVDNKGEIIEFNGKKIPKRAG